MIRSPRIFKLTSGNARAPTTSKLHQITSTKILYLQRERGIQIITLKSIQLLARNYAFRAIANTRANIKVNRSHHMSPSRSIPIAPRQKSSYIYIYYYTHGDV